MDRLSGISNMTKPVPIEATVRPVFTTTPSKNPPIFLGFIDTVTADRTNTHTIQPPAGVLWSINYVQMFVVDEGSAATRVIQIVLNNGTAYVLDHTDALIAYAKVSFGSFGNGPLILSNTQYLQLLVTTTG